MSTGMRLFRGTQEQPGEGGREDYYFEESCYF